jgi:hypothetical protein
MKRGVASQAQHNRCVFIEILSIRNNDNFSLILLKNEKRLLLASLSRHQQPIKPCLDALNDQAG